MVCYCVYRLLGLTHTYLLSCLSPGVLCLKVIGSHTHVSLVVSISAHAVFIACSCCLYVPCCVGNCSCVVLVPFRIIVTTSFPILLLIVVLGSGTLIGILGTLYYSLSAFLLLFVLRVLSLS